MFFWSLEAAIFLFSGIARIPRRTEVIPIINLKFDGITIGAASLEVARTVTGNTTPSLGDFSAALILVAVLALSAAPLGLTIRRDAGSDMSGHGARQLEPAEVEAD